MEHFGTSSAENSSFYRGAIETDKFSEATIDVIRTDMEVETRKYPMDTTFKKVPAGCFKQLLLIYFEYMDKVCLRFSYV